ncbi:hypothetical protein WICPIJ_006206 [Wickerhamomyces pijperi]|uniref:Uncharacterized protein n=1 Tax=Wickerhamomyces pijperi TaxID=599730 RepID=A0A9P8TL34_WICPI|nr:hypothetical protein WICPIJ_006206 [Wickerhamomyces pijperi]
MALALTMDRTKVVKAKAHKPKGAGFANEYGDGAETPGFKVPPNAPINSDFNTLVRPMRMYSELSPLVWILVT